MQRPPPEHLQNQRVKVYRNTSDNCLSLIHKRLVVGHAVVVVLEDVEFQVRENGRQKVLEWLKALNRKKRYLHAFANGILVQCYAKRHRLPGEASGWIDPPYWVEKGKSGKRYGPYFNYCYQVKDGDCWKTRRVAIAGRTASLREARKQEVELAIAIGWSVDKILDLIEGNIAIDVLIGDITIDAGEPIEVNYDPYAAGYFYKQDTGEPIHSARLCIVRPSGILAYL